MRNLITKRNMQSKFQIDSAGISKFRNNLFNLVKQYEKIEKIFWFKIFSGDWQKDQDINELARQLLDFHKIPISQHKARQISIDDFTKFNLIIGMDHFNICKLNEFCELLKSDCEIILLGNYNPNGDKIIHDPFIDNRKEDFIKCFEQISTSCENLLNEILIKNFNIQ